MAQIIFHGGCVRCLSQETFGEKRCAGCRYFESNRQLPDLSLSEEDLRRLKTEQARRWIKDLPLLASKEEVEKYLQEIKKWDEKEARKKAEEMKRKIKSQEAERERRRTRIIEIKNGKIVEYEERGSVMDKIFGFFYRLVLGR